MTNNVLILGGGGREHALAWKIAQSESVTQVYLAPGNAGTHGASKLNNIEIALGDFEALANFAEENQVSLTIVGPEAPLVDGVVDYFQKRGLACFGPSQGAAQLEGSKSFTKAFLARNNIPTAEYETFTDKNLALDYVRSKGAPIVIKADGLAAGKGVVVATSQQEAENAIESMLEGNQFGEAGHRVVVEEFLEGEEASFIVATDGHTYVSMATSQDHKRVGDGDTGLNTGGMGAYSPAPVVTPDVESRVLTQIIEPTIAAMREEGNLYTGFLYAGLMIDTEGNPRVIEYNCRFGDPETQPIMMRMESDLYELCEKLLNGTLSDYQIKWSQNAAVGVVLAAGGYPQEYEKGVAITGIESPLDDDVMIFHAGTSYQDGTVVTSGGRVLCATALGSSIFEAQKKAYALTKTINWKDVYYRTDIGYRALSRP